MAEKMEYRFLGRTGLKVSAIALGGWLTYGGHVEEEQTYACMKTAYDLGVNFFDTAENYADGKSEIAMGKAIKKFGWRQCDLVISTKLYSGVANSSDPKLRAQNCKGLSRKHIIEGMDASLKRLDLPYVDIVYAHRPETVRAFNYLIDHGKAFYWGTSEWNAEEIAEAWRVADKLGLIGPVVEQPHYNLLHREKVEKEFYPLYGRHGLGITNFSPLKCGILSGKYNDLKIPENSRFGAANAAGNDFIKAFRDKFDSDEQMKKDIEITRALKPIAEKLGITQSQLAIAWVLKNKNISSVITGASRPEQVVENVKALEIVDRLTPEILDEIERTAGNKPVLDPRRY